MVLNPPTKTIPNENNIKIAIQTKRLNKLGCCAGPSFVLVNADTMYADEEMVVAKKIKHEIAYITNMTYLKGKVEMTCAIAAA